MTEYKTRKDIKQEHTDKMKAIRLAIQTKMQESLTEVANTKGGLNLLRYLLMESGFVSALHTVDKEGRLDKDSLVWSAARRQVYLDVRQFMTPQTIKLVELDAVKNEEEAVNDGFE